MHTDESVPWPVRIVTAQFKPIRPNAKAMYDVQPPFQPLSAYSLKQISDGNNFKQTILNIIKNSTDIAITLQHLP